MNILTTEAVKDRNDLRFTAYAEAADGTRYRTRLIRNAYDFQCRFVTERWDGEQWREAYTVTDTSALRIMNHSYVEPVERWRPDAEADAYALLLLAERLVG